MSSIQLSISSSNSNTFSIQSAAEAFTYGSNFYNSSGILYTQGCKVKETRNCTIACQDPAQIFMSPHTLQNCMVLSALAPSNWTQPLSAEAVGVASGFAINTTGPDFPSLARNVTQTIYDCLEQTFAQAEQDGYNPATVSFEPWYVSEGDMNNIKNSAVFYNMTCPSGGALNADIGGIGVSHRCAD